MKSLSYLLSAIFITISIHPAAAENHVVLTFFIGKVTVLKNGKTAIPVQAGMLLGVNDIIKTSEKSVAEISINGTAGTIGENKSITVRNIPPSGESSPIFNTMKKISKSSVNSRLLTIAAVRAEKKDDEVIWADENTSLKIFKGEKIINDESILETMVEMIADNRFIAARDFYEKMKVTPGNKKKFDFMGGIAYYNLCYYSDAAEIFCALAKTSEDSVIKNESAFYAGLSLNSSLKYSESVPFLTAYISAYPDGNRAAQAYFLRGVSYLNTGLKENGIQDFKMIVDRFAADPISGDAESILKNMK